MSHHCSTCGATIDETSVRYERRDGDDTDRFCSLNCLADTDRFDEATVERRLFDDVATSDV